MRVNVRLFAGHRERAGTSEVALDVHDGCSVADAFDALTDRYPSLGDMEHFTTFARNRKVVSRTDVLLDGDELALLQPVSGGSSPAPCASLPAPTPRWRVFLRSALPRLERDAYD
jgi:molybdopterin synthase catalytic subunit